MNRNLSAFIALLLFVFVQNSVSAACEPEELRTQNSPLERKDSFILITAPLNLPPSLTDAPNWNTAFNYSAVRALSDSKIDLPIVIVFYQAPEGVDLSVEAKKTFQAMERSNQQFVKKNVSCLLDVESKVISELHLDAPIPKRDGENPHNALLFWNGKSVGPVYLPINPIAAEDLRLAELLKALKAEAADLKEIDNRYYYSQRVHHFSQLLVNVSGKDVSTQDLIADIETEIKDADRTNAFLLAYKLAKSKAPQLFDREFANVLIDAIRSEWDLGIAQQAIQILESDFSSKGYEDVDHFLESAEVKQLKESEIYLALRMGLEFTDVRFEIENYKDSWQNTFSPITYQICMVDSQAEAKYPASCSIRLNSRNKESQPNIWRLFLSPYEVFPMGPDFKTPFKELHARLAINYGEKNLNREFVFPFYWTGIAIRQTFPVLPPADELKGRTLGSFIVYSIFQDIKKELAKRGAKSSTEKPNSAPTAPVLDLKKFKESANVIELEEADFKSKVLQSDKKLVMVEISTSWCAPCKAFAPAVSAVADQFVNQMPVYKVDGDRAAEIKRTYEVGGFPTVLFFKGGTLVGRVEGNVPQLAVEAIIKSHLALSR